MSSEKLKKMQNFFINCWLITFLHTTAIYRGHLFMTCFMTYSALEKNRKNIYIRGNFKSNSKNGKGATRKELQWVVWSGVAWRLCRDKNCYLPCRAEALCEGGKVTAENAPFRRSKRGHFDNFDTFWNWLVNHFFSWEMSIKVAK